MVAKEFMPFGVIQWRRLTLPSRGTPRASAPGRLSYQTLAAKNMNIDDLSEQLYEDLNGHIRSISVENEHLCLNMECDDWSKPGERLHFKINCYGVRESQVEVGPIGWVEWLGSHPALVDYLEDHAELYFSSVPHDPYSVIGRLYTAHNSFYSGWRPFSMHINASANILTGGHGLIARGPRSLISALASSIEGLLNFNILNGHSPKEGLKALIIESNFVVCESVTLVADSVANKSIKEMPNAVP